MATLQPVPAPLAGPPRSGLLVAAQVINDPARWQGGYSFDPEACAGGGTFDPCGAVNFDPDLGHPAEVGNVPFGVWDADRCSVMGNGENLDDLRARARRALEANQSEKIARELWTGEQAVASAWDNQRFAAGAGVPVVSTDEDVAATFAALTQALADQQGNRRGMIHVTPRVLDLAASGQIVRRDGTVWLTPSDHIVVADAGYPGSGPNGEAATDAATWAFATGLVVVRLGEVTVAPDDNRVAVNMRDNSALFVASRLASPAWDGCALAAASIDLSGGLAP